jgi:hypothetical protein
MAVATQLRLVLAETKENTPEKDQSIMLDRREMTIENDKVSPEELRFIYKLISDGYSDRDILGEYASLNDAGNLEFPLRNSEDFISDRRQEMEVAVQILKDGIQTMLQPLIAKQTEEHQTQLSEISAMLLANDLNTVEEVSSTGIYGLRKNGMFRYRYQIRDSHNRPIQLSRYQLFNMFRKNVETACQKYTQFVFYECYIPHLKNEIPEIEEEGFWPQVERQPYEVITAIKDLTKLKTLKGVCPLCNEFESKIPPFIRPIFDEQNQTASYAV